jgi:methionyl aminopeptidase
MIGRNDPCWCGSQKKWKGCHYPEQSRKRETQAAVHADSLRDLYWKKHRILIKTPEQIAGIRAAGHLAARILEATCKKAHAGVTTQELNDFAVKLHKEAGAIAAPLHYGQPPFPKSICTSLNEVICHGIPNAVPLQEGDILNIDITCILNGFYGDCSKMVTIGSVAEEKQRVVDVSYDCLMGSIALLKPGLPIHMIGDTIEEIAAPQGCSVVNQFVGHGVGVNFHENPQVPHHRNRIAIPLVAGMTFTIEPMINAGVREAVIDPRDHWTARTRDGKPSAQWEHTVLITETGYEILTPWTRT